MPAVRKLQIACFGIEVALMAVNRQQFRPNDGTSSWLKCVMTEGAIYDSFKRRNLFFVGIGSDAYRFSGSAGETPDRYFLQVSHSRYANQQRD
jgi:hypothetical protein